MIALALSHQAPPRREPAARHLPPPPKNSLAGNNGAVDCTTYCRGPQWPNNGPWRSFSECLSAYDESGAITQDRTTCSTVRGLGNGQPVTCFCDPSHESIIAGALKALNSEWVVLSWSISGPGAGFLLRSLLLASA